MIPQINFFLSYYLQSKIILCPYNRDELIIFKDKLETLFNTHKKFILNEIKKISGHEWPLNKINIWLFKGWCPSISTPLLLNTYDEDLDFCFFNLIHELVHNNIMNLEIKNDKNEWDHLELEAIVNVITKKVLSQIFSKKIMNELTCRAEFGGFYKYVWIRVEKIENELIEKNMSMKKWLDKNE